jgi:hypothetical protein
MATAFLMSHHAFRRDLGCFGRALGRVPASDKSRLEALREEWRSFRGALHGHHEMEDTRVFPHMRGQHPELAPAIDRLSAEHQRIDPLLLRGDQAFAEAFDVPAARTVIAELTALLDEHLAFEEATVVPHLRAAKEFPAPGNDDEVAMFAQGFAWSSQGVAPTVLERLNDMLPAKLKDRLPAARAEFAERWQRAWQGEPVTASTTSVPAPAAQPK